ncbi:NADPH:quinone oxidoreductase [Nocardioides sp. GY 10113]|uniref:zinc-binding dehydrogenase n=1 Tax=Nocardioides sp. GY 10113 TaxID=2569761 RepID=UPI0010A872E8|nr:zinc-binding dehydrogenase [Nocardioides sp. GY 10113]TIC89031.1 NADPH:quinone oxidoreductase [Nocardioides sp. GY 10113]
MRAVVHQEFGEPSSVLEVADVPIPEPGPGEVRLRVLLAPIHNHDLWTVRGSYGFKPELPARAGTELVGVVDALGEGVTGIEVGQRVATGGAFGAWAEYVVTKAAGLIPVGDELPDEVAAQLVSMPFSAIALLESLGLESGDWMIQNAANGAVGRMVAQLAAARGINVIGLVRRDAGITELKEEGIGNIVSTESDGWAERVTELTGGAPIKAGVDSVGGSAAGDVLAQLGDGGTLVAFGAMNSPQLELSSGDLIFKQAVVRGFWGSVVARTMPADQQRVLFGELIQRAGDGSLTLPVEATYPFEEVRAAAAANFEPGRRGKILLRP